MEKNNTCTYGQLPHHFVGTKPTFLALSGATQTGPNTFWTKAALQYARNSGNLAWLKSYMVRAALILVVSFVTSLVPRHTTNRVVNTNLAGMCCERHRSRRYERPRLFVLT